MTRIGRAATAAALATSLGVGHAVAVPASASAQSAPMSSTTDLQRQLEQQVQQTIDSLRSSQSSFSSQSSSRLESIDPTDPRTWPVELLAAGVGIGVIAALLLVKSSSAADAETDSDSTAGGGIEGSITDAIVGSSRSGSSNPYAVGSAVGGLAALGSSDFRIPESEMDLHAGYPLPTDDSITELKILHDAATTPRPDTTVEESRRLGLERWHIQSPAMKRVVQVQIRPAPRPEEPSPILVLLDGVNAWGQSGWVTWDIQETLEKENVTLVMPTQARASFYLDWEEHDEALGYNKWESFIAGELVPLLETIPRLNANGKTAIGGLSMGATGAVTLANANPDVFDATFGLSGCYSTTSPLGYQTARLTIESRGGDIDNMLGPEGSATRERYDVTAHPEGLLGQSVYLSAAQGQYPEDAEVAGSSGASLGMFLEQGSYECTENLVTELENRGMGEDKLKAVLTEVGAHNWDTFNAHLMPAWRHIEGALR